MDNSVKETSTPVQNHLQYSDRPIFIGGTGRSGTSLVAHMIAAHPDVIYFAEPRFLVDPDGLIDLVEGKTTYPQFHKAMLGPFLEKLAGSLHISKVENANKYYNHNTVKPLLDEIFEDGIVTNERAARFIDCLFGLVLTAKEKKRWAHKTPHSVRRADILAQLFPDLFYIHIIRDPRDVLSSMLKQKWGPKDVPSFLKNYRECMSDAEKARLNVPPDRYGVVQMEDFLTAPRELMMQILEFTELENSPETVRDIASLVNPDRAHQHRWKKSLSEKDADRIMEKVGPIFNAWQERITIGNKSVSGKMDVSNMQQPEAGIPPEDQGRFILQTGFGHNGSKWLSTVLNKPEASMLASHERKNVELKMQWDDSLRYELEHGLDKSYFPYLEALDADLEQYDVVMDSNSWQPFIVPDLHLAFPIDLVIYVVRNGIQMVNSMYEHNKGKDYMPWLESDFLGRYWNILGKDPNEFAQLDSFSKWCFWWSLNEEMPEWIANQIGEERIETYRFEDLLGDPATLYQLIGNIRGDGSVPYTTEELASFQKKDVNRKISGDRSPEAIWGRWSASQKASFRRFCGSGMAKYKYSIPETVEVPASEPTERTSPMVAAYMERLTQTLGGLASKPQTPVLENIAFPHAPDKQVNVVTVEDLPGILGFNQQVNYPESSRSKPFQQWKMEVDDQPIFRYLYRNFKPGRHLEFGTWQGTGVTYVIEECDATVWTINLFGGEKKADGSGAYGLYAHERPAAEQWARQNNLAPLPGGGYRTDSIGFIGRFYLEKEYGNRVCQVYSDSLKWDITNYPDGFFDSVLIDGGHTKEIVANDTHKALKLLRPGGLIMWHDFCPDMYGKAETVTGVMEGLADLLKEVKGATSKLFWIKPSFILAGIKR